MSYYDSKVYHGLGIMIPIKAWLIFFGSQCKGGQSDGRYPSEPPIIVVIAALLASRLPAVISHIHIPHIRAFSGLSETKEV